MHRHTCTYVAQCGALFLAYHFQVKRVLIYVEIKFSCFLKRKPNKHNCKMQESCYNTFTFICLPTILSKTLQGYLGYITLI